MAVEILVNKYARPYVAEGGAWVVTMGPGQDCLYHHGWSGWICYCPDHLRHAFLVFICPSCKMLCYLMLCAVLYVRVLQTE